VISGSVAPRLVAIPQDRERLEILKRHADPSLDRALGGEDRSLVIVRPKDVPEIDVRRSNCKIKSSFSFHDEAGTFHRRLPVTDVNWLAYCKWLWRQGICTSDRLAKTLSEKQLFLRIGVTREWQGQMWRQVSGVFSVPDWLGGKCFADFGYDFTDDV
jgi:hypothetical protein